MNSYLEWGLWIDIVQLASQLVFTYSFLEVFYALKSDTSKWPLYSLIFSVLLSLITLGGNIFFNYMIIKNRNNLYKIDLRGEDYYFYQESIYEKIQHPTFKYRNLWRGISYNRRFSFIINIFFLSRKFLYAIFVVFIFGSPYTQIIMVCCINFITIGFVCLLRPFERKLDNLKILV
jgi:hypothetical protein